MHAVFIGINHIDISVVKFRHSFTVAQYFLIQFLVFFFFCLNVDRGEDHFTMTTGSWTHNHHRAERFT